MTEDKAVVKDMYQADVLINCGFQVMINKEDFEELKEHYGYDDLVVCEVEDILYIKTK